jgi:hypothetical protein
MGVAVRDTNRVITGMAKRVIHQILRYEYDISTIIICTVYCTWMSGGYCLYNADLFAQICSQNFIKYFIFLCYKYAQIMNKPFCLACCLFHAFCAAFML